MGNNVNGQLGLNLKVKKEEAKARGDPLPEDFHRCFSPEPVRFTGIESKVVKIACGEQHTLALTQRGQVYAWGQAKYGQLGIDFNQLLFQSGGDDLQHVPIDDSETEKVRLISVVRVLLLRDVSHMVLCLNLEGRNEVSIIAEDR